MLNSNNIDEQKKEEELKELNNYIELQKKKKNNLLQFLNNINVAIQDMGDLNNLNNSVLLLKNIKICLDTIRDIISNLENLKEILENISNDINLSTDIDNYNKLLVDCKNNIYENSLKIEDFIFEYIKNSTFIPNKTIVNKNSNSENQLGKENINNQLPVSDEDNLKQSKENNTNEKETIVISPSTTESKINTATEKEEMPEEKLEVQTAENIDESDKETDAKTNLSDNHVLLISEKQKKVFLPYEIKDLENRLNANKKYKTIQDIIDNEYIIPYEKYKNPIIARFREAYCLMKNKENASIFDSLDLALELSFNSLLNPAVISACKNLNELDIYLDYLETNELDKFKCFEVKYEVLPQKK